jgi:hypothetical protein
MSNEVKIRVLNENDLDAVVKIDKGVLGKERRDYWKRKIAYSDIYPRPALVAELEGRVVGFIMGYVGGLTRWGLTQHTNAAALAKPYLTH